MTTPRYFTTLLFLVLAMMSWGRFGLVATAAAQTKDMLAAQVRIQGVACDDPLRAVRDAKRSKPDHEVWVLTCKNATYRVSRYPDMAATIQKLR
jgi:hypothetical protein